MRSIQLHVNFGGDNGFGNGTKMLAKKVGN
jgi:hypothetical protein